MQADADAQATVFRKGNCAPAGLGVGLMLQLVPFHRSARLPASEPPTAVQPEDDVHATPDRNAPAGLGVGWIFHDLPFHLSASTLRGVPCGDAPTAVQADRDVHDTPFS